MECADVREEFSALIDGQLPPDTRAAVEAHLAQCAECLRELDEVKRIDVLYRQLAPQRAPADFEDRLRAALHADAATTPRAWGRRMWPVLVLAAATLLVVLGAFLLRSQTTSDRFNVATVMQESLSSKAASPAPAPAPPAPTAVPEQVKDQLESLGYLHTAESKSEKSAEAEPPQTPPAPAKEPPNPVPVVIVKTAPGPTVATDRESGPPVESITVIQKMVPGPAVRSRQQPSVVAGKKSQPQPEAPAQVSGAPAAAAPPAPQAEAFESKTDIMEEQPKQPESKGKDRAPAPETSDSREYYGARPQLGVGLMTRSEAVEGRAAGRSAPAAQPLDKVSGDVGQGDKMAKEGRWNEAIMYYRRALKTPAEEDKPSSELSEKNAPEKSAPSVSKANAIRTKLASALCRQAAQFMKEGRAWKAIRAYEEALKINPRDKDVHTELGNALLSQKRLDEAISHFKQALAIDPGLVPAKEGLMKAQSAK